MNILVLGSDGFVGRNVKKSLSDAHNVYSASRNVGGRKGYYHVDLLDRETISKVLKEVQPQVVINCAGIVENSEKAMQNPVFTSNLMDEAVVSGLKFENIIVLGSAAEYGLVDEKNIPVQEDTPLNANSGYGLSKLKEEEIALDFATKHNLHVTVARIFNPIGAGMHPRFLIPKMISQISEFKEGKLTSIEVSRLDSRRDYINIEDVALAIKTIVENKPKERVYNVGSGKSTSNGELIEIIIKNTKLPTRPKIVEASPDKEPLIAIQADIARIRSELGWAPIHSIEDTVMEIIDASN